MSEKRKQKNINQANVRAKQVGFKSLGELADLSSVSRQTLNNWYKTKRERFEIVLKGAMIKKMELKDNDGANGTE